MKKINCKNKIFCLAAISFLLINLVSCPEPNTTETKFQLLSSDEILEKMNTYFPDTEFSLQSSTEESSEDYKYKELKLSCSEFSDQTVKVIDFTGYDYLFFLPTYDFFQTDFSSTRMSIISVVENAIFTDYYSIKYQNEIYESFVNLLSGLTNSYDYKILISSAMYRIDYSSQNKFSSAEDFLGIGNFDVVILIKKEFDSSFQRTFNAFCYDLTNEIIENPNDISGRIKFYFSENYTPSEISDENLKSGDFFTAEDSGVTEKSVLF